MGGYGREGWAAEVFVQVGAADAYVGWGDLGRGLGGGEGGVDGELGEGGGKRRTRTCPSPQTCSSISSMRMSSLP